MPVSPTAAWEVTVGAVCTLSHATETAEIVLTHDPSVPQYTVTVTRAGPPWPEAARFAMRFEGGRPNVIRTDRHVLHGDGASLTVTDSGFGNVLDGLQYNDTAIALSGDTTEAFALDGAAGPVATFRACEATPLA